MAKVGMFGTPGGYGVALRCDGCGAEYCPMPYFLNSRVRNPYQGDTWDRIGIATPQVRAFLAEVDRAGQGFA